MDTIELFKKLDYIGLKQTKIDLAIDKYGPQNRKHIEDWIKIKEGELDKEGDETKGKLLKSQTKSMRTLAITAIISLVVSVIALFFSLKAYFR